jgi:carboxymethylenebutenolidase
MDGQRVDLQTTDGVLDLYLFAPQAEGGPWPPVVFYMDAFGIRPALAQMATRLASNGYVVALPNLYYRTPFEPFDAAEVAAGGPERDRFKAMIATIDAAKVMADTDVVLAHLDGRSSVGTGPAASLGYCMGGGYALRAAARFPSRIRVAASFHGGSLATEHPDSPHRLAQAMRARVYIGAAAVDASFPPEQQSRLDQALSDAGVRHQIEVYPGTRHGFAVTGHQVFDRAASERHWERLLQLLGEELPGPASASRAPR